MLRKILNFRIWRRHLNDNIYWVAQKLPQICTVILRIRLGRLADLEYLFAVTSGSPSNRPLSLKWRVTSTVFCSSSKTILHVLSVCPSLLSTLYLYILSKMSKMKIIFENFFVLYRGLFTYWQEHIAHMRGKKWNLTTAGDVKNA